MSRVCKGIPSVHEQTPYRSNNTDPHPHRLDNIQQDQACYHWQDTNNNPNVTIHATQVEPVMEIQAEEDYIPQYIDYDNPVPDRDNLEMTFYTEVYTTTIRMANDTER